MSAVCEFHASLQVLSFLQVVALMSFFTQHSMYATTCELTGIPKPDHVEFPSLVPLMKGEAQPIHNAIFGHYKHFQRSILTKHDLSSDLPMAEKKGSCTIFSNGTKNS